MEFLPAAFNLRLDTGQIIHAPASLSSATTYVILEQSRWFEKEWPFIVRWFGQGMTALDIGANHGIYAVPMAAKPGVQVFAYEPFSQTRARLEESRRLNGLEASLTIVGAALSDHQGEAALSLSIQGSELNSLSQGAAGDRTEAVSVVTLDSEADRLQWSRVDFVKLDAEGEELKILAGGAAFFQRYSPLVMFEISTGSDFSPELVDAFKALGYGVYRMLGDGSALTPWRADEHQWFELNLFAAKPDCAQALAAQGVLCEAGDETPPADLDWRWVNTLPYLRAFGAPFDQIDPEYGQVLGAIGLWRTPDTPLPQRHGALRAAVRRLEGLCATNPSTARLTTLARIQFDLGKRRSSLETLQRLRVAGDIRPLEPFLSLSVRHEALDPSGRQGEWFATALLETRERQASWSTLYQWSDPALGVLCQSGFASAEMLRRLVLQLARQGDEIPLELTRRIEAAGEPNGEYFKPSTLMALARA